MLDFITNNAVWIIIALVLIALVVIGYFVDKKGFNTKNFEDDLNNKDDDELKEIKRKVKKEVIDMNIPFVPVEEKKEQPEVTSPSPIDESIKNTGIATLGDYLNKQNANIGVNPAPVNPNVNMGGEDLNVPFGDQPVSPNPTPSVNEDLHVPFGDQPVPPQPTPSQPEPPKQEEDIWNV